MLQDFHQGFFFYCMKNGKETVQIVYFSLAIYFFSYASKIDIVFVMMQTTEMLHMVVYSVCQEMLLDLALAGAHVIL